MLSWTTWPADSEPHPSLWREMAGKISILMHLTRRRTATGLTATTATARVLLSAASPASLSRQTDLRGPNQPSQIRGPIAATLSSNTGRIVQPGLFKQHRPKADPVAFSLGLNLEFRLRSHDLSK